MKFALLLSLMTASLFSNAQAGFFGRIDKYIITKTNQIIEVASNDIENGYAKYYDYKDSKRKTISLSEISKNTNKEISGVKAGEIALVTTGVANATDGSTISRYCEVFYVFENKRSLVGCKTYEADNAKGVIEATRLDFIVNVDGVTAEVESLEGFYKNETVELANATKLSKAGRNMKIMAIFANGEVLLQKAIINSLDTGSIVYKHGAVERVTISDLSKLN